MKIIILEKIFKILNDNDIKTGIDKHDIIVDTDYVQYVNINMSWQKGVHAWKSIDDFLFSSTKIFPRTCIREVFKNKCYCNRSIFDFFNEVDQQYMLYQNLNYEVQNIKSRHLSLCHVANKILNQIQGNSLEEIAVKLDLLGI